MWMAAHIMWVQIRRSGSCRLSYALTTMLWCSAFALLALSSYLLELSEMLANGLNQEDVTVRVKLTIT